MVGKDLVCDLNNFSYSEISDFFPDFFYVFIHAIKRRERGKNKDNDQSGTKFEDNLLETKFMKEKYHLS